MGACQKTKRGNIIHVYGILSSSVMCCTAAGNLRGEERRGANFKRRSSILHLYYCTASCQTPEVHVQGKQSILYRERRQTACSLRSTLSAKSQSPCAPASVGGLQAPTNCTLLSFTQDLSAARQKPPCSVS